MYRYDDNKNENTAIQRRHNDEMPVMTLYMHNVLRSALGWVSRNMKSVNLSVA